MIEDYNPKFHMKLLGLCVPDPFSGSILKPEDYPWYKDTFYVPERPWTGDKWPFDDGQAAPYVPKVPWAEPRKPAKDTYNQEHFINFLKEREKKNHKWENFPDGGSKFTLELVGRPKESVAVEIKHERWVVVSNKSVANGAAQIGGTYDIPSPENLQLDAAQLTMEHGLLTIIFPPKKVEKKVIKLL